MKVIEGKITSKFGSRIHPVTKAVTHHDGIDISAPVGTPVYAPIDGVVKAYYYHDTGGKTLIIGNDEANVRFGFAHLDGYGYNVSVGKQISKGQVIAYSGNSGRSTGPHLHFSAKTGGRWKGNEYVGGDFVDSANYLEITI